MLSKCSMNISNGIPLWLSQRCGISTVPSEEQRPQIGHLPAHECEQFRVICYLKKALWISEGLSRNWPFLVSLRLTVPAS